MKLIYGTKNIAKINSMQTMLEGLPLEIEELPNMTLPNVTETGNSPLENARIKATAYYDHIKKPVFSCDSGLYIEGLPDEQQPGVHVRRVNGKSLTDEEMIEYYSNIANQSGGMVKAYYQNSICLVLSDDVMFEYGGDELKSEPFLISSTPHQKRVEGFPINSLSIRIETGEYYMDSGQHRKDNRLEEGFKAFFHEILRNNKGNERYKTKEGYYERGRHKTELKKTDYVITGWSDYANWIDSHVK